MSESEEIIVTTEANRKLWTACVWDSRTGTALMTYKCREAAGPHSACILGNDYLLLSGRTRLYAWPLNSQIPAQVNLVCPGKVNAVAASPEGTFLVTAIGEKLHVWQTATGQHLAVANRHFQEVNCVCFTDDSSHFISGGDDGQVLVWSVAYLIASCSGYFPGQAEPRYIFSDHALGIQDIFVGIGGMRAHFASVSLDKSCRIYDLNSGQVLAAVLFDVPLSAVTMNVVQTEVFVGSVKGIILQFNVGSLPRTREHHVTDNEKKNVFIGHSRAITCLSISQNSSMLLSGSYDKQVIMWDIRSRQSIRVIEHEDTITNAFFARAPNHIFSDDFKPQIVLANFQTSANENPGNSVLNVRSTEIYWPEDDHKINISKFSDDNKMKDKLMDLTKKNVDLYEFAMKKIFNKLDNSTENEEEKMEAEEGCSTSKDSNSEKKVKPKEKANKNQNMKIVDLNRR